MFFHKRMCIMCRSKMRNSDFKIYRGRLGVCGSCYASLPFTGKTMSFASLGSADYIISPFYYKNSIRNALLEYKFHDCYAYADIFAALMEHVLKDMVHLRGFDILIPIPLSKKRMTERGYNQAALIADSFAEFIGVKYMPHGMERVRETNRQSGLKRHERAANVKNAFAVRENVKNKRVIVFDDIYTTGSTIEECAKTLKAAGAAEVIGITVAAAYKNPVCYEAGSILF